MRSWLRPFSSCAIALLGGVAGLAACTQFCGCSTGVVAGSPGNPSPVSPASSVLRGVLHGGQNPVSQSKVYLYAVGVAGYGSASTSLLTSTSSNNVRLDSNNNGYVLSAADGNFDITGDYACPTSSSLVYLLAVGGDSGEGQNASLALMAALGNCRTLLANAATTYVVIDEVTTVTAVYALNAFMTSSTMVGAPPSNLVGITNSFTEAMNLTNNSFGLPYAKTPAGNGLVPYALIDSIADFIAVCVNSSGTVTGGNSTPCDQVFSATTVGDRTPTDTIFAVRMIATNPSNNVMKIIDMGNPQSPFQPTLAVIPNDLTMPIVYTGGGLVTPQALAVDGEGNVWIANAGNSITELAAGSGGLLLGTDGFTSAHLDAPTSLAIDTSGKIWITNCGGQCSGSNNASSVTLLTPGNNISATAANFQDQTLSSPYGIAIDATGRAWIANATGNSLTVFNAMGVVQSGASGYVSTFQSGPVSVVLDSASHAWAVSPGTDAVVEFASNGSASADSYQGIGVAYPFAVAMDDSNRPWVVDQSSNAISILSGGQIVGTPISGGGLAMPNAIAFDGASTAWVSNGDGSLSAFSKSGSTLSPATGYIPGLTYGDSVAVDGSGSLWISDCGTYCTSLGNGPGSVYQLIGIATPVVTPISLGVKNGTIASRP